MRTELDRGRKRLIWLLVAALLLVACGGNAPAGTGAAAIVDPTPTLSSTPSPTRPTETPPPPSPTPTPTPTSTPTPTPMPITLSVPAGWEAAARAALATLTDSAYDWQLAIAETAPTAETRRIVLARNADGLVVRQEPLALALPFTAPREALSRAEADAILAGGDEQIAPRPWSAMEPRLKALRVDGLHPTDDGYPYREHWSLVAGPGTEAAAAELAPAMAAAMAPAPDVHLVAVGDVMLDRFPGYYIAGGDLGYPWTGTLPWLQAGDYTIANLESALGDVGEPVVKAFPFRAPPAAAASVAYAGIDLVSLANNHGMDYGPEALLQGIELLQAQGVATVGGGANAAAARAPHIVELNGLRVAFLGYVHVPIEGVMNAFDTQSWTATADAPGLAWADPEVVGADVAAIRPAVDLVVVILHSGYEYQTRPSPPQIAAARAAVEAGAALVVGHHAHILQGIEYYQQAVIAYGLGNFAFEIDGPPETAILNVWLDADGVRQLELIPAVIQPGGVPRPAEPWEAAQILADVYLLTSQLNPAPVAD